MRSKGVLINEEVVCYHCVFSSDDHANDPGWLAEQKRLREKGADIMFVSYTKETGSSAIREKARF